ncbi:MBL fold metallo-hydrolase [Prauserella halophila]|uniref:MBL fold metallo-hydrolase n=1 Tax=Prauserella halophila TaxID=185641 RepID=A0ABP4GMB8_9PSEU|nr:MBL fold metallo-hydrolase [Prauserella halophila]MCP2238688.1 Glyoxylase, beta-lactamase superfamily II [Prauserella halophila]
MQEVAADVFCAEGTAVNWVLLRDGTELTLIDAGWSGDTSAVEDSVRALGRHPRDVQAVLLTHAHPDHMGAINHFHERYATPVFMSSAEVTHARGGHLEQARPADIVKRCYRPSALRWTARIMAAGALKPVRIPHAQPYPRAGALDLPGTPVPVACAGHTSGHSAFHLPDKGVVITGDALITGHPLSPVSGPQLLPPFFAHAPADAEAALQTLAGVDAEVLIPGHGVPWRGTPAVAAEQARRRASITNTL